MKQPKRLSEEELNLLEKSLDGITPPFIQVEANSNVRNILPRLLRSYRGMINLMTLTRSDSRALRGWKNVAKAQLAQKDDDIQRLSDELSYRKDYFDQYIKDASDRLVTTSDKINDLEEIISKKDVQLHANECAVKLLKEEVESLKEQLKIWEERISDKNAEIEKMKVALEFYANDNNWLGGDDGYFNLIGKNHGSLIAIQCLDEIKGGKEE